MAWCINSNHSSPFFFSLDPNQTHTHLRLSSLETLKALCLNMCSQGPRLHFCCLKHFHQMSFPKVWIFILVLSSFWLTSRLRFAPSHSLIVSLRVRWTDVQHCRLSENAQKHILTQFLQRGQLRSDKNNICTVKENKMMLLFVFLPHNCPSKSVINV